MAQVRSLGWDAERLAARTEVSAIACRRASVIAFVMGMV